MEKLSSIIEAVFGRYAIIIRYLISGASSFGTNIILLYLLTEYAGIYYLASAVLSFIAAFIVSFLMMKHWTFRDGSTERVHRQVAVYLGVALVNLLLNTLLVYLFVEKAGVWYILAQVFSSILIAVWSFFIYKNFIFA